MKMTLANAVREMMDRHWTIVEMAQKLGVDVNTVAEIVRQILS